MIVEYRTGHMKHRFKSGATSFLADCSCGVWVGANTWKKAKERFYDHYWAVTDDRWVTDDR